MIGHGSDKKTPIAFPSSFKGSRYPIHNPLEYWGGWIFTVLSDAMSKTPPDTSHFIEICCQKKLQSPEKELHVECNWWQGQWAAGGGEVPSWWWWWCSWHWLNDCGGNSYVDSDGGDGDGDGDGGDGDGGTCARLRQIGGGQVLPGLKLLPSTLLSSLWGKGESTNTNYKIRSTNMNEKLKLLAGRELLPSSWPPWAPWVILSHTLLSPI